MKNEWMYILDEHGNPVHCPDVIEWGEWMSKHRPDPIQDFVDSSCISTVFMGVDLGFCFDGSEPPLCFETMIFGGVLHSYFKRTCNLEQAEAAHRDACQLAFKAMNANLIEQGLEPNE